jgi:hypothetical protein
MSIKLRAMFYALGIFLCVGVGANCLVLISNMIPPEYYFPISMAAIIGMIFYFVYSVIVAQLEYQAKLAEIAKK